MKVTVDDDLKEVAREAARCLARGDQGRYARLWAWLVKQSDETRARALVRAANNERGEGR
jgi:hypothetical protein